MNNDLPGDARYKTIVELAPDVVYTISKSGNFTSLSSAFEKITGWKRKEWIGKNFAQIVHPADLPKALINFSKTLRGESRSYYRLRIRSKKGNYILGEFKSAPEMENGKIVGVIGIGRDITNELKKHEELVHYKNLVQSSDSAIISRDIEGNIVSWNKAAENLFGYKAPEVIGKHFSFLVPKDNKDELKKISQMLKKGKLLEDYETVRVTKEGKVIDIIAKISPIVGDDGQVIGTSVFDRDNTYRRKDKEYDDYLVKANKILFSSLSFGVTLRKLAKIMVPEVADWCSIHIGDSHTLSSVVIAHEDPDMIKWAEGLQKKFGSADDKKSSTYRVFKTGKSELYKKITDKLIVNSDASEEQIRLIKKLNIRSVISVPIKCGKKILGVISLVSSQDNRYFDESDLKFAQELGNMAGQAVENAKLYHMAKLEIDKRKKIENELRSSRDQLGAILENTADGITLQDSLGKLVYANRAAALASGYKSVRQMLKNPKKWSEAYEVKDENDNPYDTSNLPGRRALTGEHNPQDAIFFINKKTGEKRWSIVKARAIKDNSEKISAVVNIISDITQSKELERKKDDFISIASHELKTPITSIKGFMHLLKQEHKDYQNSRSAMFINRVDAQLDKLMELIEDLLNLSKLQTGKLSYKSEPFDISELVTEVIGDLRQTTNTHKIHLRNKISRKINGDRDRISQVLINLISNAIKYSPNRDKVVVSMKNGNENILVSVKDYGIGMDKDEAEKIFDRFYRVKDVNDKTFPGLGIGLYISKEIIQRHNGEIWATSQKKKGSVFQFALPIY